MKQSAYFTFEIDGVRVGFYEEHDAPAASEIRATPEGQGARVLRMSAWIALGGTEHVNRFAVRYVGNEVLAYLTPAGAWVSVAEGTYPSAALSVLARRMQDGDDFSYLQIDEGLGRVVAHATLRRQGDTVVETVDDEPRRRVVLSGGRVVAYGWGGSALSRRVPSRADAVRGTVFAGRPSHEVS